MQLVGAYRLMYAATPASRLEEGDCAVRGVLLDGFPRTRRQAEMLGDLGVEVTHTLILDMPDEVVISRVSGRRIDPLSGKIYHIHFNPPETEAVANRLIQREDDTRTKIMRRLEGYHSNKAAIAEYYGDLVSTVRFAPPGTIAKGGLGAPARRSLALDAKPMLVHDELRKVCCIVCVCVCMCVQCVCVCACASSGTVGMAQPHLGGSTFLPLTRIASCIDSMPCLHPGYRGSPILGQCDRFQPPRKV